jgi:hypothetical protein
VSGMKPIFTSFFSGASEPCAQAPLRTASGTEQRRSPRTCGWSGASAFLFGERDE